MITDNGNKGVSISYTTTKALVHESKSQEEQMQFIVDNRPIVIYQFWIDTGYRDNPCEIHKMLYSKAIPAPDSFVCSDVA